MSMVIQDIEALRNSLSERDEWWDKSVGKAWRSNASIKQAAKLKLLDRIEDRGGSWIVDGRAWWYPQARKWRVIGGREYIKARNFTDFWGQLNEQ